MIFFCFENILIYQTQIPFTEQIQNNCPYPYIFFKKKNHYQIGGMSEADTECKRE